VLAKSVVEYCDEAGHQVEDGESQIISSCK